MIYAVKDKEWKSLTGVEYLYTGEVDLNDNLCGFGTAITTKLKYPHRHDGTFFNGKIHGFGK